MKLDALGDVVYSKMQPRKQEHSSVFYYAHDDAVSEANRKRENQYLVKEIVKNLRQMEIEATNGFANETLET